jgi:hypothetical protein
MSGLHSKLGASSSHRWMHCPGSVRLIEALKLADDEESDGSEFAARGTLAHWVGSECLDNSKDAWEYSGHTDTVDGHKIVLDADDMRAVQAYLDYIRAKTDVSNLLVEHAFHVEEIHPQFWGTSDCAVTTPDLLEIVDYKHGVGVAVDAIENTQLMMYAAGVIVTTQVPRERKVRLTIVQPRAFHAAGPIRSWDTTAGAILDWIEAEWLPAAKATEPEDAPLAEGAWCRFCTAILDCPKTQAAVKRLVAMKDTDMAKLSEWELSEVRADAEIARVVEKRAGDEIFIRLQRGKKVPGWKLVQKKADRVFKTEIEVDPTTGLKQPLENAVKEAFGDDAYERKIKSPAVIEKLPGGKAFVKTWAYKPETGLTLAPIDDARPGVAPRTRDEIFAAAMEDKKPVASDF